MGVIFAGCAHLCLHPLPPWDTPACGPLEGVDPSGLRFVALPSSSMPGFCILPPSPPPPWNGRNSATGKLAFHACLENRTQPLRSSLVYTGFSLVSQNSFCKNGIYFDKNRDRAVGAGSFRIPDRIRPGGLKQGPGGRRPKKLSLLCFACAARHFLIPNLLDMFYC